MSDQEQSFKAVKGATSKDGVTIGIWSSPMKSPRFINEAGSGAAL